ncbi:MAG TPA: serine hydrolase, partial [Gemmatimonadaceae bacterium]|nr:serine hydrolase [Gemmatimonadaceae bacterium]
MSALLSARIAQSPGAVVRIVARRLDGRGPQIEMLGDSLVHAASTMKVPVMIALAQAADQRALNLDSSIAVTNRFKSIVDSSPYSLP